jgi:hypothetical protein
MENSNYGQQSNDAFMKMVNYMSALIRSCNPEQTNMEEDEVIELTYRKPQQGFKVGDMVKINYVKPSYEGVILSITGKFAFVEFPCHQCFYYQLRYLEKSP